MDEDAQAVSAEVERSNARIRAAVFICYHLFSGVGSSGRLARSFIVVKCTFIDDVRTSLAGMDKWFVPSFEEKPLVGSG